MQCESCGSENPTSNKFCGECGQTMVSTCPSCSSANPPGQKFCGECGTQLSGSPPPTQTQDAVVDAGERRFVSALFADLVGFTPFTEERDPEEVRAMLTRYFDRSKEIVERFGGEVDKFIGDAVTAFWGATAAQEDDAERAVRAALELVDSVAELGEEIGVPELKLRAGVLSGETSVGSGGNEKGLVVGDIVNTAARLQGAATPGTVLVGDSTKALSENAIVYEPVGERELKGKSVPVTAWRAKHVAAAVGGRGRASGLEAPFIGRSGELRLLKDQLHATSAESQARLVSIVGEAGIGKSRLAWELQKYVDGLTEVFRWHEGRSPAYGGGVTLWAVNEMIRSRAGITETEDHVKARTKLRTSVVDHIPNPEEQQWVEPRLAAVLGLDSNPSGDRNELFSALRTFFQRLASGATTVMVFEDLHWADESQLDFIEELVELSHSMPILVVTLARPELLERRPTWGSARRNRTSVHLGPMTADEMSELVSGLAPGIPDEVVHLVTDHAAGVPLYAVEYVRTLVDSGDLERAENGFVSTREVASLSIPDSLHAVVGARLDRLDPAERSLIQDAAVLGQSFTLEGLTVLSGRPAEELETQLRDLARRELLQFDNDPRSPERGQYQFVQGVIREVAYGRIAKSERRQRHVKVAEYFAEQAPIEAAAVIASHYVDAYEAEPDADLANRARDALMGAARRAADLHSGGQALELAEQALEVPGSDADRAPVWMFLVQPASSLFRHELALSSAQKAAVWFGEHGSPEEMVLAATALGSAYLGMESPDDAAAALTASFDPGRLDEPAMRKLGSELARAHMLAQQDLNLSADVAGQVLVAAEDAGDMEMLIEAMNTRGTAFGGAGRLHESGALLREAVRLAGIYDVPVAEMRAINNLLVIDWSNGLQAVETPSVRGFDLAQRLGRLEFVTRMLNHRLLWMLHYGEFEEAAQLITETETGTDPVWSATFAALAALIEWHQTGDLDSAQTAAEAAAAPTDIAEPQMRAAMADLTAMALYASGDLKGALDLVLATTEGVLPANELYPIGVKAALELGDTAALAALRETIGSPPGRRGQVFARAADAAMACLDGRDAEAVRLMGIVFQEAAACEGPMTVASWRAVFGRAAATRPEGRQAAVEAYEWFSSVGDNGDLDRHADVWRTHGLASEASAVS